MKPLAKAKQVEIKIKDYLEKSKPDISVSLKSHLSADFEANEFWIGCQYAISHSHDICKPKSWVFYKLFVQGSDVGLFNLDLLAYLQYQCQAELPVVHAGQISDIVTPALSGLNRGYALINNFTLGPERDPLLKMPVLNETTSRHFVPCEVSILNDSVS